MSVRAVLFDLDGTLLDTLQDLVDSVNELLEKNGLPQRSFAEIRSYMGNGAAELVQCALPQRVGEAELEEYLRQYREIYAKNMERHTGPYPGIPEMLQKMKDAGIKTGVISNKPDWATRKLSGKALGTLLDAAVGDRPGEVRRKPDPQPLELMMEQFGVSPQETIYVGDSEVDIETARNAGLEGIAVSWGFRDRPFLEAERPDHLVDTPDQLWELIAARLNS
ncbi:MAG: HAD-IIIA family hydrolase [Clostridia bacterium]|nr:HAD-IIIA family hydrolase [Clostridia bacterium]